MPVTSRLKANASVSDLTVAFFTLNVTVAAATIALALFLHAKRRFAFRVRNRRHTTVIPSRRKDNRAFVLGSEIGPSGNAPKLGGELGVKRTDHLGA